MNYLCWLDANNKRHFTNVDNATVVISGINNVASVFINGYDDTIGVNTSESKVSNAANIFVVSNVFEALRFVKSGITTGAIYGTE